MDLLIPISYWPRHFEWAAALSVCKSSERRVLGNSLICVKLLWEMQELLNVHVTMSRFLNGYHNHTHSRVDLFIDSWFWGYTHHPGSKSQSGYRLIQLLLLSPYVSYQYLKRHQKIATNNSCQYLLSWKVVVWRAFNSALFYAAFLRLRSLWSLCRCLWS